MNILGDFIDRVLDLIYPVKCVICNDKVVKRAKYICNLCKENLKTNVKVTYLKRVQFGEIKLDDKLELGQYRELTDEEIVLFKQGK